MNNIDPKTEDEIREFLLGRLADADREALEARLVADAGLFENAEAIEHDLTDQYVRDALSDSERDDFERHLMRTARDRERVEFARLLRSKLVVAPKSSEREGLLAWLWRPRFALAFGALAVLVVAAFLVLRTSTREDLRAEAKSPTPTPVASSPTPTPAIVEPNTNEVRANDGNENVPAVNVKRPPANDATPTPPPRQVTATIALLVPTIRGGGGGANELRLTNETTGANFELGLDSQDYREYRAEIVDAEGRTLYRSGRLTPRRSRLHAFFPTAKLKNDDYLVRVFGLTADGLEESAADFQFRVSRK